MLVKIVNIVPLVLLVTTVTNVILDIKDNFASLVTRVSKRLGKSVSLLKIVHVLVPTTKLTMFVYANLLLRVNYVINALLAMLENYVTLVTKVFIWK